MSTFTDYASRMSATDKADWLGVLAYFTVSDANVPHDRVVANLTAEGLEDFAPARPKDADVFRKVWTNGQRRGGIKTWDAEVTENVLVREISRKEGRILKRIVVERVDAGGKALDYAEKIEVGFNRQHPEQLDTRQLNGWHSEAIGLSDKLTAEYATRRGCIDGDAVRRMVRRVFETSCSTLVRDGLYFVPAGYVGRIEALERAAREIEGASVHSFPLIDDAKQRANLKDAFEAEVTKDVDELIDEILDELKGGEVGSRRAETIVRRRSEIESKITEYRNLLEDNLTVADVRVAVLQAKVGDLLAAVKA